MVPLGHEGDIRLLERCPSVSFLSEVRAWLEEVPYLGLFTLDTSTSSYYVDPTSELSVGPNHLSYFKFIGRLGHLSYICRTLTFHLFPSVPFHLSCQVPRQSGDDAAEYSRQFVASTSQADSVGPSCLYISSSSFPWPGLGLGWVGLGPSVVLWPGVRGPGTIPPSEGPPTDGQTGQTDRTVLRGHLRSPAGLLRRLRLSKQVIWV